MRRATVITLGVAALFATGAVLFGRSWLDQQNASAQSPGMATVVVSARALKFGDALGAADVREVRWPAESVPQGAFRTVAELRLGQEQRQALQEIAVNEPIIASRVTGSGQRAILSAVVTQGMRAFAIRVDDVVGVGGFVLPNDRVDIILVRAEDANHNNNAFRSDLLLQNVRVLGIDQEANAEENTPRIARAVTLEVTAEQAQMLSLASQAGSLRLALRNQAGNETENTRTITIQDLRNTAGASAQPTAQHRQPRPRTATAGGQSVVVVRGDERAVTHVAQ